ncbi:iron complex outermembrane receptor protein [Xanthomonas sacchari]|uniref:TonB-dependent siderophore receptor n=1 Tax=unclassified Xanthomonas TaxID=2643310 RepID=UPI001370F756|nr:MULTISPECIES: TonB-dependent siderophore receptor [unclassified Xanthomonas]MBB6365093.1 iron complex outermembrane receptor protein [Xanthomonas sp. F10]MXV34684.1 TonB-dependent siderophore receptor [Xanthomonas sp. LMG 8989]
MLPTRRFPAPHALALGLAIALPLPALAADDAPASATAQTPVELDAVNVQGRQPHNRSSLSGYGDAPLLETPMAIDTIDRTQLADRQVRVLSEVLRADAAVGDSYAPIGYYENFLVRGYSLDAANSYRINGLTIAGEQNVALENKEQVQVLKGLSGVLSGITTPAGVIDYQTKRPQHVRSLVLSGDDDGSRGAALDLGDWFGSERQFGLRVNAAHETLRSYVDHADGHRNFLSLAADWNIDPQSTLQLDVEYQDRQQRSVPGYQLLGGTQLPSGVSVHRLLAYQPWSRPVGIEALNAQVRYEYRFSDAWNVHVAASHSRALIDDYSSFAWGCYGAASCAGDAVPNHFSREGDYDIYDYRSPADSRRNDELQAIASGSASTGVLQHQFQVGVDYLHRTIDRHGSINEMIGSGNIDADPPLLAPADAVLGPKRRRLDSAQTALLASDRIGIGDAWQLLLGARQVRYDERAWDRDGTLTRRTRRSVFLPQAALLFKVQPSLSLYASFAKGLAPGGAAPWFASNADSILAPTSAYQREVGMKYERDGVTLGAALFDMRQAYQYAQPQADGSFLFVQQGRLHNRGIELSAAGTLGAGLHLQASVAGIRARAEDTGTPGDEGHQALNVPRLRASAQATWDVPGVNGLALLGGAQYSGAKYADRSGQVAVGGYSVYNLGARYATRLGAVPTTLRLSVDNLTDKRYWRDVGAYEGDDYLFLGAPRTARLAVQFDF